MKKKSIPFVRVGQIYEVSIDGCCWRCYVDLGSARVAASELRSKLPDSVIDVLGVDLYE